MSPQLRSARKNSHGSSALDKEQVARRRATRMERATRIRPWRVGGITVMTKTKARTRMKRARGFARVRNNYIHQAGTRYRNRLVPHRPRRPAAWPSQARSLAPRARETLARTRLTPTGAAKANAAAAVRA